MTTIGLSYSLVKRSTKCAPALEVPRGWDGLLEKLSGMVSRLQPRAQQCKNLAIGRGENSQQHVKGTAPTAVLAELFITPD